MKVSAWHRAVILLLAGGAALGFLIWKCRADPEVNFLPGDSRADWVILSTPFRSTAHRVFSIDATFRRDFSLDRSPASAPLEARGAKRLELKINGAVVPLPTEANWKRPVRVDVAPFLRNGANQIEARVFNDVAPPALWLHLHAESVEVRTDTTWQVSIAGSSWQQTALASQPRFPGRGNEVYTQGNTWEALRQSWPFLLLALLVALGLFAAGTFVVRELRQRFSFTDRALDLTILFIVGALWTVMICQNSARVPFLIGFDAAAHVKYVDYLRDNHRLPSATEGYEMYQPPLYYLLAAGLTELAHSATTAPVSIFLLRLAGLVFGIAQFVFVFLTLRALFPEQRTLQRIGLLFAAFMPMQLYLAHYVTNEQLAAALMTASIYLGVRIALAEAPSWPDYLWLGLALGAALLTKATALLILPPLLGVVAFRSFQSGGLRRFGVTLALILFIAGWHYLRIWRQFGTPLLGNWDAAAGFPLWQDPGLHAAADYIRFGRSLTSPFFSGINGFLDGIYSTAWGDGLLGGISNIATRPPWSYGPMQVGYLLAVLPTLLLLAGFAVTLWKLIVRPTAVGFLLVGIPAGLLFGVVYMTLRVPSYAQIKAFYAAGGLIALSVFLVYGCDLVMRLGRRMRATLIVLLLTWAITSFCAFWIGSGRRTEDYVTGRLGIDGKLNEALARLPTARTDFSAQMLSSILLLDLGSVDEAQHSAEEAVRLDSTSDAAHLQLSAVLLKQNDLSSAIDESRRAVELGPENGAAYNVWLTALVRAQRPDDVVAVARDALAAVTPASAELHHMLALALAQRGDFAGAIKHFGYAAMIEPRWSEVRQNLRFALSLVRKDPQGLQYLQNLAADAPDSPVLLNELAWIMATSSDPLLRQGDDAVRIAARGSALRKNADPELLCTLGAAYAEAGRFADAIATTERASDLARGTGDNSLIELSRNLLESFRANRAYRGD